MKLAPVAILTYLILLFFTILSVSSSSSRTEESRWETLTKLNYSSEIRRHRSLLIIVTLPWSGESRSLMKEVSHLVTDRKGKLGHLKLRAVYRNSEKMLADILGATDGITIFYYHNSTSYKYQGHLRARDIVSSIYQLASLQFEEAFLKTLHTQDDIESFIQSTDKAVILLEFCGWSAKLMQEPKSVDNKSDYAGILSEKLTRVEDGSLAFDKKSQEWETEELACSAENGFTTDSLHRESAWANQSPLQAAEISGISCTLEAFSKFQSFFSNFRTIAREHYLQPQKQRFGLISNRTLVPLMGVDSPETWLLIMDFPGCVNCSIVHQEGDDLRTFIHADNSFVMELGGHFSEPVFQADQPSIILFIDRSSDISEVRENSKSSLEVLRRFALHNRLSYQMVKGANRMGSESSSEEALFVTRSRKIADNSDHRNRRSLATPMLVKPKDKMSFMILKQGESISLENIATVSQSNSAYDILAYLVNQENHAFKTKEKKISSLAKEVGFHLLSDDFDVQVVDSLATDEQNDKFVEMLTNANLNPKDKTCENMQEPNEHGININSGYAINTMFVTAGNEGKQAEVADRETVSHQNTETVPYSDSNTSKSATKLAEEDVDERNVAKANDNDHGCMEQNFGSCTCRAENSSDLEEESPVSGEYSEQEYSQTKCNLNRNYCAEILQDLPSALPGMVSSGDDAAVVRTPMTTINLSEPHVQPKPFFGPIFYSDGGYQLLRSLSGGSKIPSLVILDPVLQQHYVLPGDGDISLSSLISFVDEFLNSSLTPFQKSASPSIPRDAPQPPFVNLDFRETDCIPPVNINAFCELVVGYKDCELANELSSSNIQNLESAWRTDVLVAFSTPWCGFCQRMELIVREVYRALKNFKIILKSQSGNVDPTNAQGKMEDNEVNIPSVFLMDCTENECGPLLKSIGKKEQYPALLLFPAQNKTAISYEGDASVVNIFEFLLSQGSNSHFLSRHKGFLWTQGAKPRKTSRTIPDASLFSVAVQSQYAKDKYNEVLRGAPGGEDNYHPLQSHTLSTLPGAPSLLAGEQIPSDEDVYAQFTDTTVGQDHMPVGLHTSNRPYEDAQHVTTGSVLAATDKLHNSFPFGNSTIVIVRADQRQGFQGLIINKHQSWDVFKGSKELELLRQAPLYFGGPVRAREAPLVSLTHKPMDGFTEVQKGLYFGDPLSTNIALKQIISGNYSVEDYYFYLGYSSWDWNQLFEELEEGAWSLISAELNFIF